MARCFPFNCSDYLKQLEYAKDEALIESIKLQTEKENAKERKKEKKEKKHKSGKSKEHQVNSKQEERSHKKRKHSDRNQLGDQGDFSRKPIKDDVAQQVDKSSLTEENGAPCFNLNPNDSSDSTQDNSSKRRKLTAPSASASASPVPAHSSSGLTFRFKPLQKQATDGERPATSAQLLPRISSRAVDGEQLQVKNRSPLVQGPPVSNKLDGERPAASVQFEPRFSGRAVDRVQLQVKDSTPLIQESSDSVPPSSNKLAGVFDRKSVLLPKLADGKRPATSVQPTPRLSGRAADGGQLQAKNRTPVMQKSSGDLVPPSSNKLSGFLDRNNVLPPKPTDMKRPATSVLPPKPTDRKRPATGVLPQPRLSGRAVDGGQPQVKNRTPVIQKSGDLVPPSPNKLDGVLDKKNVLLEPSVLQKPTGGMKPATSVLPQPRLSGQTVVEGQLQAKKRTTLMPKSVPPFSKKLTGDLDRDNFLLPPSQLQKSIDGKKSATSVQTHPKFTGQAVDGGQQVKNRTPLIQNNRDPAPPFSNKAGVLDRVLPKPTNGERPATSGQTESSFSGRAVDRPVKNRTPVSQQENRYLGPPASNKLDGVSDMDVDPPLPKVLPKHNAPEAPFSSGVMEGVTVEASQGRARNSKKHKSSRSGSKDEVRRLFNELIVNWAPPALQLDLPDNDDDQDWLFASKRRSVQRCVPSPPPPPQPEQESSMPSYQPRATYLPEVDMYALPYVVPF